MMPDLIVIVSYVTCNDLSIMNWKGFGRNWLLSVSRYITWLGAADRRIPQTGSDKTASMSPSTMTMAAEHPSEILVKIYQSTRHYNSGNSNFRVFQGLNLGLEAVMLHFRAMLQHFHLFVTSDTLKPVKILIQRNEEP
jgi:hypothetical protein